MGFCVILLLSEALGLFALFWLLGLFRLSVLKVSNISKIPDRSKNPF
jgi:hypothetical protein